MCTQHISALEADTPGFSMTTWRGISDLPLMRTDVSSVLILFYLALSQSLFTKEQDDKSQKAALPLDQSSILFKRYKTVFQGSNSVT